MDSAISLRNGSAAAGDDVAELDGVDAAELEIAWLREENASLRRERERLKTDLLVADAWVRELATWVEEAEAARRLA